MKQVFYWSLVAAFAGLLFGFDTVVISGADKKLQSLWGSSDAFHGSVVMAMALWGTVAGALFGAFPTQRLGRKKTLLWVGVFYSVSAIGSALANDPFSFAIFRFIGGLGVGVSTIAAPAYISEIAPAKDRGRLVGLYQFSLVLGILLAFVSNYLLSGIGENAWRWMMGVEAFPAIFYTLLCFRIPRSPRWLISSGLLDEAKTVFMQIDPEGSFDQLVNEINENSNKTSSEESIFDKKYRFPLKLAFLVAFFNQLSGINAFLYYAPRIFEEGGLGESTSLLSSIGIGVTNLIFTFVGISLIDKLGRRSLMYYGSFGYIISLSLVACAFFFEWGGLLIPVFLFLFIASHAIGQGAIIWVYISEIFPNHLRNSGQSFGVSVHWVLAAIIPSFVPLLFASIGPGVVFSIFAIFMVFQLIFVHYMMPETRGISLEELSKKLISSKKNV
ncbi:MAG: sugar porter family MFS transporter [Flavobacteriaceae bacterium]|jgi:sugar porter (SP) family MFS transporter|tara:strand:- start:14 stop:1342 length:1329 start_codon:yes stop_codon:yes gene_type:complete